MKQLFLTSLLLISSFLFSTTATSAPLLKVYEVTNVKVGDSLNMRAWPDHKSKTILAIPHNATWVASNNKPVKKGKSTWQKIHWNGVTGWVNAKYLKYDANRTLKAKQRRDHRMKQQGISRNRNTSRHRTTVARNTTTPKAVATTATGPQVMMECGGNTPFWNISMNFTGKSLKVNMRDGNQFDTPLYFRKWVKDKNEMVVNGGRGRNAVRAILTKTNSCTDGITNIKYPFVVTATVSGDKKVTGCCRSVQHK
jgi:uncharacterized membrane protein